MKRSYTIIVFAASLLSMRATAQIPNAGFETWANGQPAGWYGSNTEPTATAHSGSSAIMGQVGLILSFFPAGVTTSNLNSTSPMSFPYTGRPGSFTGYYQFAPMAGSNDSLEFVATFMKSNSIIAIARLATTQSASSYTQFTAPIAWSTGDAPDSAMCSVIILNASASGGFGTAGSTFKLDDVSFSGAAGVAAESVASNSLSECNPNPVYSGAKITYCLANDGPATLAVFDVMGRQVGLLASGYQTAGNHMAIFDGATLPAGVYYYRLVTADQTIGRALQLLR